jgi:hypothetical protein
MEATWVRVDSGDGKCYFYHTITRETRWTDPADDERLDVTPGMPQLQQGEGITLASPPLPQGCPFQKHVRFRSMSVSESCPSQKHFRFRSNPVLNIWHELHDEGYHVYLYVAMTFVFRGGGGCCCLCC